VRNTVAFSREVAYGVQHVPGHFITEPQLVSSGHPFDYELLLTVANRHRGAGNNIQQMRQQL